MKSLWNLYKRRDAARRTVRNRDNRGPAYCRPEQTFDLPYRYAQVRRENERRRGGQDPDAAPPSAAKARKAARP